MYAFSYCSTKFQLELKQGITIHINLRIDSIVQYNPTILEQYLNSSKLIEILITSNNLAN